MTRVALVTAEASRGHDEDEVPLLDALIWRGVEASVVAWDDRRADWAAFDAAILRSTWDYHTRHREFVRWLHRVERRTRVLNPVSTVEWSLDKTYLRDLADAGVPIVPTTWLEPGDAVRLPDRGDVVVKPVVSAGSADTRRFALPEHLGDARAHAQSLLDGSRSVMVQPYLASVEEPGEVDLVYLGSSFSHAVRKAHALPVAGAPAPSSSDQPVSPTEATPQQRAIGDHVMSALAPRGPLLYARIDLVAGVRDEPLVLEVELAEPSLFLVHAEGAVERFADAIATALTARP
jgi:glutathione synthase/RimK-type ligase-like ATP-grasp enzyme